MASKAPTTNRMDWRTVAVLLMPIWVTLAVLADAALSGGL